MQPNSDSEGGVHYFFLRLHYFSYVVYTMYSQN